MSPRKRRNGHSGLLGDDAPKLQPKLRMVANGSAVVNAIRAEHCAAVAVKSARLRRQVKPQRGDDAVPKKLHELPKSVRRGTLKALTGEVMTGVFIQTTNAAEGRVTGVTKAELKGRSGNLLAAEVKVSRLPEIAKQPNVRYVELAEQISLPRPVVSRTGVRAPSASVRRFGKARDHHGGKNVIIGLIDVEGFDFAHPDFLTRGGKHTRFSVIWDQGGTHRRAPGTKGQRFDYGSELTKAVLDRAIVEGAKLRVAPQDLEPQSETFESSHGTHVASIAAGNRGVCPQAEIAAVLIALPKEDLDRRKSFYDSRAIVDAVDYLLRYAEGRKRPISINISLGTNGHAHDASSAASRWIDAALATPGRSVCVAAGNAGQEVAEFEGDIGYTMGRIHTSGKLAARELARDIEWVVVGNGIADISENELEIWYSAQDRFAMSVLPPGYKEWIGPVEPRTYIENQQLKDGSFLSIYNELYQPANGHNYIAVYLSPLFSDKGTVGVRAGEWLVRLHGREVRDGRYHGWIERDDAQPVGREGPKEQWSFPSFFSERSNVDNSSVSSLACGQRIISVANLDEERRRIAITSSQGPTRDGRFKPDVAAPGTDIVAANGFAREAEPWVKMSGTSMASPRVAGVIGLMLSANKNLTAAQIEGIIQRTAQPLPGNDFAWANDAGFGVLDAETCVQEATLANKREDKTP